jgi:hypothetical protein
MNFRRQLAPLLACLLVAGTAPLAAQGAPHPVITPVPAANPQDVESLDAIVAALYDVISGPSGQARNWNRMRSLFVPGGLLIPTGPRESGFGLRLLSVNDYVATSGPALERIGFTERELARRTERYGNIAHVFSTYEGTMETEPTVIRGINSIQLMHDGRRWWILSVFWEAETAENPLPAEYLP